ncbi:MAG: rhamnogalacturonan acetylesterase, partial [Caulobacter sp.]|nr:rhamnogalacturonan acetylesterase [Caulobacter sp.]
MTLARREVLAGLALSGLAGAAAAQPAGWRFDFQGGRPAVGYRTVAPDAPYNPGAGFGFEPRPAGAAPGAFQFSVAVPEGDYRVTVTLGDARTTSNTTIKAESRRLMLEAVETARGAFATRQFVVNVRNASLAPPPLNAPGGDRVLLNARERGALTWDDKLTLEILGPAPRLARLEIVPVVAPTVFLAGDSTVTDQ